MFLVFFTKIQEQIYALLEAWPDEELEDVVKRMREYPSCDLADWVEETLAEWEYDAAYEQEPIDEGEFEEWHYGQFG